MNKYSILSLALLFSSGAVCAASFDCAKAQTFVEKTICSNPELNLYDEAMGGNYSLMMRAKDMEANDKAELRSSQMEWIKDRNKCNDPQCILSKYKSRLDDVCDYPAVARSTRSQCIAVEDIESSLATQAKNNTKSESNQNKNISVPKEEPSRAAFSKYEPNTGGVRTDAAVLKNIEKIKDLGFSNSELKSMVYTRNDLINPLRKFVTLEGVLGALFESDKIKEITPIKLGKNKGFLIKAQGIKSTGFLFKFDGGDAFISHLVEGESALPMVSIQEEYSSSLALLQIVAGSLGMGR